jgi:hypothetical protein
MRRVILAAIVVLAGAAPAASHAAAGHRCRTYDRTRAWVSPRISCVFAGNIVYFYEGMVYHRDCRRRAGCNLGPVYSRTTGRAYRVFCRPRRTGPVVACWIVGKRRTAWLRVPIRRIVPTGSALGGRRPSRGRALSSRAAIRSAPSARRPG